MAESVRYLEIHPWTTKQQLREEKNKKNLVRKQCDSVHGVDECVAGCQNEAFLIASLRPSIRTETANSFSDISTNDPILASFERNIVCVFMTIV